jgi:TerC family integral membrane protein
MRFATAIRWSLFYIAAAMLFGVGVGVIAGWDLGAQFFAGYVVEKSLSVDNLFVFAIIMTAFAVPTAQQPKALTIGIALALALRAVFIALGAALLTTFSFMFLVFGLALVVTAIQLYRHRGVDPSVEDNAVVSAARRLLPLSDRFDGGRMMTRVDGRRVFTPMLLVLLAIGSTDVVFAFDSIPAVFGVTNHAWIVFAANVFALLGLRALYFLVSGLLDRLVYLSTGLAVILGFIGVKLVLEFAHGHHHAIPEISTGLSLAVIAVVLTVTAVASLLKVRRDPNARTHAGALRDPAPTRADRSARREGLSVTERQASRTPG